MREPLRVTTSADHRRRRRGGLATRRKGPRALRAAGVDHGHRPPDRAALAGMRDLTTSPSTRWRARPRASRRARSKWPSCRPRSPTRRAAAPRRSASATTSPSTRRAARSPPTRSWPPAWCGSPKRPGQIRDDGQAADARPRHVRSVPAAEPGLHPGGGIQVSHQPCAIVGIGQTKHKTRRDDVSLRRAACARPRNGRSTTPR